MMSPSARDGSADKATASQEKNREKKEPTPRRRIAASSPLSAYKCSLEMVDVLRREWQRGQREIHVYEIDTHWAAALFVFNSTGSPLGRHWVEFAC